MEGANMSRVVIRPAASSAVTSVNAQTGVVVLDAGDVGAVATDTSGSSDVLAIWGGTQAEYDAIGSPTATTLYVVTA
jgi:hypothetical protein